MTSQHLIRLATVAGACLATAGFAGLSVAAAGRPESRSAATAGQPAGHLRGTTQHSTQARRGVICIRYDADDTPQCLGHGPRGLRGPRGRTGRRGARGAVGLTGVVGPAGTIGPTGLTGATGIQGFQGIMGQTGAFAPGGRDPGGNLEEVLGSKIGPITFTNSVPGTGTELTPSVARCPIAGVDTEAYDGGAMITTSNPGVDVVGLESSFPGLYAGASEVDPLPLGATPGSVSTEAANAYEAQAVISSVRSNDQVTVQSYVVCGP
jgi:hypothetical protein